jgi:hypothetical protein
MVCPGNGELGFADNLGWLKEWNEMTREVHALLPSTQEDVVYWSLEPSGCFTTKSAYLHLSRGATITCFKEVWRTRVPPRIKVFLCKLIRTRLPSSV